MPMGTRFCAELDSVWYELVMVRVTVNMGTRFCVVRVTVNGYEILCVQVGYGTSMFGYQVEEIWVRVVPMDSQ